MDHMLRELTELKYIRTGAYTHGNEYWGSIQQVNTDHMVMELSGFKYIRTGSCTRGNESWGSTREECFQAAE
jgi:hypothetical protein